LADQRGSSAAAQRLEEVSREVGARLKEFEAALRVIDALRGAWDDGGSGDALLRRLLGGEASAPSSKASKRQDDPVPVMGGQPVDLGSRELEPLPVLVIATTSYRGSDQVGVVGVTADGQKRVVVFRAGSTADPVAMDTLCRALEARALSPRLCVTDGGLALDRELADSFPACLIAHADSYVERAVLSHLADGPAQAVKARLRAALDKAGGEAEAALTALVADMRPRAPGTYQTLSRHLDGLLALRRLGIARRLERSLSRGAVVATCAQEARALGRRQTPPGEDPILYGVEGWEAATRRLIGHEHLPALFEALARRSKTRQAG
jgi:hypothetical protein